MFWKNKKNKEHYREAPYINFKEYLENKKELFINWESKYTEIPGACECYSFWKDNLLIKFINEIRDSEVLLCVYKNDSGKVEFDIAKINKSVGSGGHDVLVVRDGNKKIIEFGGGLCRVIDPHYNIVNVKAKIDEFFERRQNKKTRYSIGIDEEIDVYIEFLIESGILTSP